jgi:hypothetical protein
MLKDMQQTLNTLNSLKILSFTFFKENKFLSYVLRNPLFALFVQLSVEFLKGMIELFTILGFSTTWD